MDAAGRGVPRASGFRAVNPRALLYHEGRDASFSLSPSSCPSSFSPSRFGFLARSRNY